MASHGGVRTKIAILGNYGGAKSAHRWNVGHFPGEGRREEERRATAARGRLASRPSWMDTWRVRGARGLEPSCLGRNTWRERSGARALARIERRRVPGRSGARRAVARRDAGARERERVGETLILLC